MPLTQEQINNVMVRLDGDPASEDPRGLEHILSARRPLGVCQLRDQVRMLLGAVEYDPATGNWSSEGGFHEELEDAEATQLLNRLRGAIQARCDELKALI